MLSPSTCTTRPSTAGNAVTTSWSIKPKVAPTWSAMPACAGPASTRAATMKESAAASLEDATAILKDNRRLMDTENAPQRIADLAERHLRAHGVEDERDEVVAAARGPAHGLECSLRGSCVACAPEIIEALSHRRAHGGIDLEETGGWRLVHDKLVDPHHEARLRLDVLLVAVRRLLDFALHEADGADGAAEAVDLGDVGLGLLLDPARHRFHRVRASQRIRGVGGAGLVGEHLLGTEGEANGGLGGQGEGLVHRVGVQRLAASENGGQRLDGHPHDVVLGLLGREHA